LGQGSYGSVYNGSIGDKSAVVKVTTYLKNARTEISVLTMLKGKEGVPNLIDWGHLDSKTIYIVLDRLGDSLERVMRRRDFTLQEVLWAGIRLLKTLE
jgi:predicted Ser/Thr protein kinase